MPPCRLHVCAAISQRLDVQRRRLDMSSSTHAEHCSMQRCCSSMQSASVCSVRGAVPAAGESRRRSSILSFPPCAEVRQSRCVCHARACRGRARPCMPESCLVAGAAAQRRNQTSCRLAAAVTPPTPFRLGAPFLKPGLLSCHFRAGQLIQASVQYTEGRHALSSHAEVSPLAPVTRLCGGTEADAAPLAPARMVCPHFR
jgi:hypothetical protein